MSIYLLHRMSKTESVKFKMPCTDMQETVKSLKDRVFNYVDVSGCSIDFIYRGLVLEDKQTLSQIGIKPDVVVHILTKPLPKPSLPAPVIPEEFINQVHKYIMTLNIQPNLKMAFMKISRPEYLERIMKNTPRLKDDPTITAMLQDPFLITTLTDVDCLRNIAEEHPAFFEAFRTIVDIVKELKPNAPTHGPGTSSGFPYSWESLIPESDSESSESSEYSAAGTSTTRNHDISSGITPNQLQAALAFANNSSNPSTPDSLYPRNTANASSQSAIPSSNSVITSSMFNDALSQAMSQVRHPHSSGTDPVHSLQTSERARRHSIATQLQRMREIGLTNDAINIQALMICNGDVQDAINLVFSGAIGNNQ